MKKTLGEVNEMLESRYGRDNVVFIQALQDIDSALDSVGRTDLKDEYLILIGAVGEGEYLELWGTVSGSGRSSSWAWKVYPPSPGHERRIPAFKKSPNPTSYNHKRQVEGWSNWDTWETYLILRNSRENYMMLKSWAEKFSKKIKAGTFDPELAKKEIFKHLVPLAKKEDPNITPKYVNTQDILEQIFVDYQEDFPELRKSPKIRSNPFDSYKLRPTGKYSLNYDIAIKKTAHKYEKRYGLSPEEARKRAEFLVGSYKTTFREYEEEPEEDTRPENPKLQKEVYYAYLVDGDKTSLVPSRRNI
jgi:hypothetical protein